MTARRLRHWARRHLLPLLAWGGLAFAATACTPDGSTLLVADVDAQAVYFFRLPDMELAGTLSGVKLGAHAGALPLADGRVVFVDENTSEFVVVSVDGRGRPTVVARAPADIGHGAAWGAADESRSFFAVSSEKDGDLQTASLLDLRSYAVTRYDIRMKAEEELHPYLLGSQLTLVGGVGGELQAYRIDPAASGLLTTPTGTAPVGAGGHGPVVSHKRGRVYLSTLAGLDGASLDEHGGLTPTRRIPWDVDGRAGGRNARPRLSWDGDFIYGAVSLTTPAGPERWADRAFDVHMADLQHETARRIPLGSGLVSRFQLSQRYGMFVSQETDGDHVRLLDVDPRSPSFQKPRGDVVLAALASAPVAGVDPAGSERRAAAIDADGSHAYVSHGGDGLISVVDNEAGRVIRTINTPTALRGGGYLVVIDPGVIPADSMSR